MNYFVEFGILQSFLYTNPNLNTAINSPKSFLIPRDFTKLEANRKK